MKDRLIELIKRSFELWMKKRWLKTIDKEADKYNKLSAKLKRQQYIVNDLLKKYNQIYSPDELKGGVNNGKG